APDDVRFAAVLVAWGLDLLPETALRVADRLGLAGELRNAFLRAPEDLAAVRAPLRSSSGDSPLAALARGLPEPEAIALATALPAREAARFRRAREKASRIRLSIRGEDLRRSGMAAGPAIGRALDRTWRARVDGRI